MEIVNIFGTQQAAPSSTEQHGPNARLDSDSGTQPTLMNDLSRGNSAEERPDQWNSRCPTDLTAMKKP